MVLRKKVDLKRGLVNLKITDKKSLLLIDDLGNVREFEPKEIKLIGGLKTGIKNTIWNSRTAFSSDGRYLVYAIPDSIKITIFSIKEKEILYTIGKGFHQGNVTSIAIDNRSKYFLSGGEDGRAILWNISSGETIFAFPRHKTPISATSFSRDGKFVSVGDTNGLIHTINLSTMKPFQLIDSGVGVRQLLFLSSKYIISLDKSNSITLWRYTDGTKVKELYKLSLTITKIALSIDEEFLFISTQDGNIILYNLVDHKVINRSYIRISSPITGIESLVETGDLIVSDTSGHLHFFNIYEDQKLLARYIRLEKYKEAYKLIESNDILKFSNEFLLLEKIWEKIIHKAEKLLEKGVEDTIRVELMLEPFSNVAEKRDTISTLLTDFKFFKQFKHLIYQRNYYLAYDVATKHQALKKTKLYSALEHIWDEHFKRAKSIIFDKDGEDKAKEILLKFRGISDKATIIKNLFEQKNIFMNFQNLIRQRHYQAVFELVNKHPFLEGNSEYQDLLDKADDYYINAQLAMKKKSYDKAVDFSKFLLSLNDYKENAQKIIDEATNTKEFLRLWKSKEFTKAYEIAEKNEYISEVDEFKIFEERWLDRVFKAEESASKGEIDEVKKWLREFFPVKQKFPKMASIFKIAYLKDMNNTFEAMEQLAEITRIIEVGVRNYIQLFGKDQEIMDFIDKVRTEKRFECKVEDIKEGNIDKWTPENIVDSIIDLKNRKGSS